MKWITIRISDDNKSIILDGEPGTPSEGNPEAIWESFLSGVTEANPRWYVYDFGFDLLKEKAAPVFISW